MNFNTKCWTLEEDLLLLDGLSHCGFGNWEDISKLVKTKTLLECEHRYMTRFLKPEEDELKQILEDASSFRKKNALCSNNCSAIIKPAINFMDNSKINDKLGLVDKEFIIHKDTKQSLNTVPYQYVPGHNPHRSDFDVEYDDNAEVILQLVRDPRFEMNEFLSEEDCLLHEELRIALTSSYNFRLNERAKKKEIIKSHALIDLRKNFNMSNKFDVIFGSKSLSILLKFLRFFTGPELDLFYETLNYETEIRTRLFSLINYRGKGIRHTGCIPIYERLNKRRVQYKSTSYCSPLPMDIFGFKSRKSSAPLILHNLPGYHLLDETEKEVCSNARIIPETYYNFKQLLISECKKHDGLKLAQARLLIKIDVNKTRKMYDYLLKHKYIWNSK